MFADIANAFEDGDGDLVGSPALRRKRGKDRAGNRGKCLLNQDVELLVLCRPGARERRRFGDATPSRESLDQPRMHVYAKTEHIFEAQ